MTQLPWKVDNCDLCNLFMSLALSVRGLIGQAAMRKTGNMDVLDSERICELELISGRVQLLEAPTSLERSGTVEASESLVTERSLSGEAKLCYPDVFNRDCHNFKAPMKKLKVHWTETGCDAPLNARRRPHFSKMGFIQEASPDVLISLSPIFVKEKSDGSWSLKDFILREQKKIVDVFAVCLVASTLTV